MKTIPVYWWQNIQEPQVEPLNLTATYDPLLYQTYDNYSAIEVSKVKDIPKDYNGLMGVPTTFIVKHLNSQFELVQYHKHAKIDGKEKYARLLIRRKR